ncbi:bifunctional metallophosphatase/5'-nucleotidase [Melittangium boletus]|uniref:bifunctional metallophosphatase/5'-nucleotidase n=1 Tax=Melittangium boletus TaxID=83453 RepID=UPI003DA52D80
MHLKTRHLTLAGALAALALTASCGEDTPYTPPTRDPETPLPPVSVPPVAFTLQVLHGSDMESGVPATDTAPLFSAVIRALEEQDPTHTLKLASGDLWLPGVFYNAGGDPEMTKVASVGVASPGRADIAMFNEIGFHAASFGNHEFDSGPREISNIITASGAWSGTKFPYLSANLDFSNSDLKGAVVASGQTLDAANPGTSLHNKVTKSVIFTVDGQKIGVVGATTPQLPRISSPGTVVTAPTDSANYDELASIIQAEVNALRTANPDLNKVVLMSHMQQYTIEVDELPKRLDGVDVIVAGGNHAVWTDSNDTLFPGDVREGEYPVWKTSKTNEPVAVVNVASNWRYVGRFNALFDDKGLLIRGRHDVTKNGAYASTDAVVKQLGAESKVNAGVKTIADTVKAVVNSKDGALFGKTTVYLNGLRPSVRTEETNMGNLFADACVWYGKTVDPTTVISLANGGTFRDAIGTVGTGATPTYGPPAANPSAKKETGDISQLDIENSLRFNNPLVLVTVTATQLKEVLENGVSRVAPGATEGRFPQVGGLRFEYDASKTGQVTGNDGKVTTAGQRVRKVVVTKADGTEDVVVDNGAVVGTASRTFRMVTSTFLAGGGDGYPFNAYTTLNRVELTDGSPASFTSKGREQNVFSSYMAATYPKSGPGYGVADTARAEDKRVVYLGP